MKDPRFFEGVDPAELAGTYGTPLYIYNERVFRTRCREMKNLVSYPNFRVNYSVKANSNLTLLKIAHEEGLLADAMSPGEIFVEEQAGFLPEEIFYISNNVSASEMAYAVERGITVSIDSLSQLERFGKNFPRAAVSLRINSGVGAGHSAKVVTGGKLTKFAITPHQLDEVRAIYSDCIVEEGSVDPALATDLGDYAFLARLPSMDHVNAFFDRVLEERGEN